MKNTTLIYTAFTKESIVILLFLLCINSFYAQVKIGENPQVIDPTSLLELESNSRTLVLSRVSTNEMQAILPLRGALLYNTDAQCIFYFNGTTWVNLCQGGSNFSITDNGDNTYTVNDGINPEFTFSTNSETITNVTTNSDGTYTYTNEAGEQTIIATGTSTFSIIDNGDNTYTVNDGTNPEFTFSTNSETITSIAQNGDGTYTYTNEAGEETIIATGTSTFSIIDNGDNTYTVNDGINPEFTFSTSSETITNVTLNSDGTYTYTNEAGEETIIATGTSTFSIIDNGDNTYTVNDGTNPEFTFSTNSETITSITQNADGTYTYTNEAGEQTIITTGSGAGNVSIIDNGDNTYTVNDGTNPEFTITATPETVTSITQNADGSYTYTNEAGAETNIASSALTITDNGDNTYTVNDGANPAFTITATPETVTSITQNADGSYTYTNEAGAETNIASSALTITDNGDNTYTVNDGTNPAFTITATPETVTSITQNADGSYTYTNEAGAETNIASSALTITDNGDNTYTVNDGTNPAFTISAIPETTTSLIDNANGTYTYTNEAGDDTIIETNALSITDNGDNTYTVNDGTNPAFTITATPETITSLTENANGTYTYTNEAGTETVISLSGSSDEGSVFFADDANGIIENNTQFFWDNTNERLGIGTNTNLTDKLNLNGTLGIADGSEAAPSYRFSADPDTGIYRNAENEIGFTVGGSSNMRLTPRGLYLNNAIPLISGFEDMPLLIRANPVMNSNKGELIGLEQVNGDLKWIINIDQETASVKGGLSFVEAGGAKSRFYIENARTPEGFGRIGINTDSPQETLHVVGDLRVTDLPPTQAGDNFVTVDQFGRFHKSTATQSSKSTVNSATRITGRWMNVSTSLSLNNGQAVLPLFEMEDFKDGGTRYYEVSANNLNILSSGRYEIKATIALIGNLQSNGQPATTYARITVNAKDKGAINVAGSTGVANRSSLSSIQINDILEFKKGDKITITLYTNASSSFINLAAAESANFTIIKQ